MEVPPTSGTPYTVTVGPETLTTAFTLEGGTANQVTTTAAVATDSVTSLGPYLYDEGSYINVGYPNTTAGEGGVTCPNAGQVLCLVTGQAPDAPTAPNAAPVAVASVLSSGWSSSELPAGVSQIESSACGSICVGVGFGPNGSGGYQGVTVVETNSSPGTWPVTAPAGVTNLTQVTCPTPSTCFAIGSGASSAVLLAGQIAGSAVTWTSDTLPAGVSSLSEITCAGGANCLAIGSGASGAVVVAGTDSASAQTWVADTLPAGVSSLSEITCAGGVNCLAIGSGASGAVVVAGTGSASAQTWVADTLPAGVSSLSEITCAGTTACLAVGSTATGPTIVAGAVSATSETFVSDSLPSVDFLSGLACFTSGAGVTCEAPGANAGGAVVLTDASLTSGADTWTSSSLSGAGGLYLANLPISVNSTDLSSSFVACAAGACGSSIGPLFPFANGYSVGAGDCSAEVASGSSLAATKPGASGSQAASVTLPLGLLPIEVTNASGAPLANATVTAKVADPNLPQDSTCNDGTVYSLPTTGPDGLSELAAMYETYTVSVTSGSTTTSVTIQVTPYASIVETVSGGAVTVVAVVPLPEPVVVRA
jgi:hypothetical protein